MEFDLRKFSDDLDNSINYMMNISITISKNKKTEIMIVCYKDLSPVTYKSFIDYVVKYFSNKKILLEITEKDNRCSIIFLIPNNIKITGVKLTSNYDEDVFFGSLVRYQLE